MVLLAQKSTDILFNISGKDGHKKGEEESGGREGERERKRETERERTEEEKNKALTLTSYAQAAI